jgi:hypothetical protein
MGLISLLVILHLSLTRAPVLRHFLAAGERGKGNGKRATSKGIKPIKPTGPPPRHRVRFEHERELPHG